MKINKVLPLYNKPPELKQIRNTAKTPELKTGEYKSAAECCGNYNRAMIASSSSKEQIINTAKQAAEKVKNEDETVSRINAKIENGLAVVRFETGKAAEGFNDIYYDDSRIACFFDKNNEISSVYKLNNHTNEINVYDKNFELTHSYTKDEIEALKYYKYHPDAIHISNREGRNVYGGDFQKEAEEMNSRLEVLFNNDSKLFATEEDTTLYRALPDNLTKDDIIKLTTPGEIYEEKSFVSTTSELNVAKRFQKNSPILKINVPKGSKYIDIEKLFNIDRQHWKESELFFNKGSKFEVKSIDPDNNIIEVEYKGD